MMVSNQALVAQLVDWLLTYAVHSSVLLVSAWLAARVIGPRRPALQQLLWRGAMLGAVLTATLQVAVGVQPLAGTIRLAAPVPTAEAADTESGVLASARAGAAAATPAPDLSRSRGGALWTAVGWLWVLGAALGLTRIGVAAVRLRRLLTDRRPLPGGRLMRRLAARMGVRRMVRLSSSEAIPTPFATGIVRPEICVPGRLVGELSDRQKEALVAHEMAHVARHDPGWQLLHRLVEGLLFFQPLNRLARRRLEEAAELRADDLAASAATDRLALAQCLVEVARRTANLGDAIPAAAAIPNPSRLRRRVERLLAGGAPENAGRPWAMTLVVLGVMAATMVIPAVSSTAAVGVATPGIAMEGTEVGAADEPPAPPEPRAPTSDPAPPADRAPEPAPEPRAPKAEAAPVPHRAPAPAVAPRVAPAPAGAPAAPAPVASSAAPNPPLQTEAILERMEELQRELARLRAQLAEDVESTVVDEERRLRERELREQARLRARAERERLSEEQRRELRDQAREKAERARSMAEEERGVRRDEARAKAEEAALRERELHGAEREEARQAARELRKQEREARAMDEQARQQARELAAAARARQLEEEARARVEAEEKARAEQEQDRPD